MAVQSSSRYVVLVAVTIATILSVSQAQAPNQAEYLAAHNAARSVVGVVPLVWNDTCYSFAASWAAGCVLGHNANRGGSGENIAWGFDTVTGTGLTATQAVNIWISEQAKYDYASNICTDICGHYTQVVWNTTTTVGCASADCGADGIFHVCDYSPPGNMNGRRPY